MTDVIQGRKGGGGSSHTPTESPDSIQSIARAKILLALGEGEFAGGLDGQNIFLDGTPVFSPDGTLNYPGFEWDFRPGTQMQNYIQGMPGAEYEASVGVDLKATQPWVRAINNTQLSAVRVRLGWQTLVRQEDNGDRVGTRVDYAIDLSTDGGAYQTVLNGVINDKTTSLFERSHRVNLPAATTGWQIRLRRITPDSTSSNVVDLTRVMAITEVIDAKLRYPNTALLFVSFDAKQFPNIPQISCKPKGRVIRVPTTYDPESRTYSGTWDGSFKWAYSNNPAWVFYDILLNKRFGLGDRLDATQVDEVELYRIAQYCDQRVPDGRGGSGTEPRFVCDVYIQAQNEAFTVLRDLASIFRGMTYWANNQVCVLADMPRDMDFTYTRANVIDGKFHYQGGSFRNRYSSAMVSWSNPDNHYQDEVEAVMENALVERYGINQTEISAIGCTRQTEANRRGRWALLTNSNDRTISFSTGLDGYIPLPGRIIGVADQMLAGRVLGGRISAVNGRVIKLDRVADVSPGDRLIINLPNGSSQARTVSVVSGTSVTVSTAYNPNPEPEAVWSVDAGDLAVQQYRVSNVTDNDDGTFTISAVWHSPGKYDAIDTGARLDERPISVIPPGVQAPPTNIQVSSFTQINQGIAITTMRANWDAVDNAVAYEAEWRRDDSNWVSMARTSALGFEVQNIFAGRYLVRVRAINASDVSSIWGTSKETRLNGKEGKPPKPVGFATTPLLWGIGLSWNFPAGAGDTLKTEIQYADNAAGNNAMLLSDVPYPQRSYTQSGLQAGQEFWYRARLVDRTGNQGDWIDWVRGQSNGDADDYLHVIGDGFMSSADGDRLSGQIDTNIDAILQNALANNATVDHQWAQYGEVRADSVKQGGTGASDATTARSNLGLGTAATATVGANSNQVMLNGAWGLGGSYLGFKTMNTNNVNNILNEIGERGLIAFRNNSAITFNGDGWYTPAWGPSLWCRTEDVYAAFNMASTANHLSVSCGNLREGWVMHKVIWHSFNTVVDGNGFIKKASPVTSIYRDGTCKNNMEAEGVTCKRLGVGIYHVDGCLGAYNDNGWKFEVPKDENGSALLWVDYEVKKDGSIIFRTYHRTNDCPILALQNNIDGYANGDSIDIPEGKFLMVRLNVPNSQFAEYVPDESIQIPGDELTN